MELSVVLNRTDKSKCNLQCKELYGKDVVVLSYVLELTRKDKTTKVIYFILQMEQGFV